MTESSTLRMAISNYANFAALDLKSAQEIQSDLRSILGARHLHQASIGGGQCALCLRPRQNFVHLHEAES